MEIKCIYGYRVDKKRKLVLFDVVGGDTHVFAYKNKEERNKIIKDINSIYLTTLKTAQEYIEKSFKDKDYLESI